MANGYDVIILGGGLNGCSTAYWLKSSARFDGSVLVVERDPSYQNAPSARATGGIRQQFSTPENVQIGLFGAEFVKSIDTRLGVDGEATGVLFREQGYLLLARCDQLGVMHDSHAVQRAQGARIVHLDGAELAGRFPWVACDEVVGGFFGEANEGWVDPYSLLQAFKAKALSLGVEFVQDEALDVAWDGTKVSGARLRQRGDVNAGVIVNTAGASGARALVRAVGEDIPIESRQRCTFIFECRAEGL